MFKIISITAGESHGKGLMGILEGIPANLPLDAAYINRHLKRRQKGYGRGGRMKIESDTVEIISGVRWGRTLGSPIGLFIRNRDWENWKEGMSDSPGSEGSIPPVSRPRPGHADLPGILKYNQDDIRNILERSSARETAARVALGSVARAFLELFNIRIGSFVTSIGEREIDLSTSELSPEELQAFSERAETSDLHLPEESREADFRAAIDQARDEGYSLGGIFTVFATGLPPGLGSHIQWNRRLDARLAHAFMGIQAIKGVEIGDGFMMARRPGNEVLDEILPEDPPLFRRETNHAGGIEGGMTNGMPVIVRAAMKPIPTQRKPLRSIDILTGETVEAAYERSDVCAVPAASVIGEAALALVLADAFLEKFGGDSIEETRRNLVGYMDSLSHRFRDTF
jgi:chorismate synthase